MKCNLPKTLTDVLQKVQKECVECGLCLKDCMFLQEYGSPKQIAEGFDLLNDAHRTMAYACSLCHLCTACLSQRARSIRHVFGNAKGGGRKRPGSLSAA